jgi:hypothetical protein
MNRRAKLIFGTILMGSGFLTRAQNPGPTPVPVPAPIVTPEPVTLPSVALGLSMLLSYGWWRRSRSKRRDS